MSSETFRQSRMVVQFMLDKRKLRVLTIVSALQLTIQLLICEFQLHYSYAAAGSTYSEIAISNSRPGNHPSAVPRQSSAACAYCAVAHSDGDASGNPPGGSTPRITEQRTQCGYSSSDTEGKGRSTISVIAASEACPVGKPRVPLATSCKSEKFASF